MDFIERIYTAALEAAHAGRSVSRVLVCDDGDLVLKSDAGEMRCTLRDVEHVYVVGAGKATASMACAVEKILGNRISDGIIAVKYGHALPLDTIRVIEAAHPVPDVESVRAAYEIQSLLERADARDLVIALISGGASSLLCHPAPPVTLDDKRRVNDCMLRCGASIDEINCVRKHISCVKGGMLARAAFPARVYAIAVSDVVGDDLSVIGSAPLFYDMTTFSDAMEIIQSYGLGETFPETVMDRIRSGMRGTVTETPKRGDLSLANIHTAVSASNRTALSAAADCARELGFDVIMMNDPITGDTTEAARIHAQIARHIYGEKRKQKICVVSGGETTVRVVGRGKGGRNTEFALALAIGIDGMKGISCASIGTDGTDGATDVAGARATSMTVVEAKSRGIDPVEYLRRNDSYSFFELAGGLVRTGPTETNVCDIHIVFMEPYET